MVESSLALGSKCAHQRGNKRTQWDGHPDFSCRRGDDAEILVVQVDPEARLELARAHLLGLAVEDAVAAKPPASTCTAASVSTPCASRKTSASATSWMVRRQSAGWRP